MDATARKLAILDLFKDQESLKISDLCKKLNVSRETVRRDLAELQEENQVKLIRGGATLNVSIDETPYEKRLNLMVKEKEAIAEKFCGFIHDHQTIYLDFGTTCLSVAKKLSRFSNLSVVTNSLPIINELYKNDNITLFVLGGVARKNEGSFAGETARNALKTLNINVGFFSGGGFDINYGLSNYNIVESEVSRDAAKKSQKVFVGVDHSKINSVFSQHIADTSEIDTLITNSLDDDIYNQLKERVNVVLTDCGTD